MTDLTDEAVKALLDGATPGPWRADGEPWNRIVWSSADNRVCFMAHSSGLNDARDIATSNLVAAAPDLARALLAARAELARVRADAQAAVARAYEAAAERLDLAEHDAEERDWRSGANAFAALAKGLRALAPADGLAAVEALRVEARENAMQALASMGQAQEAYEAQLEAEAELAAAQQREAELLAALEDPLVVHLNMVAGKIAKPLPSQLAHIYGEDVIRAALAQTPTDPGDGWTWNERLGWIGPDGKPADPRRRG